MVITRTVFPEQTEEMVVKEKKKRENEHSQQSLF